MDDFRANYVDPRLTKLGNIVDITAKHVGWTVSWCIDDDDDGGHKGSHGCDD